MRENQRPRKKSRVSVARSDHADPFSVDDINVMNKYELIAMVPAKTSVTYAIAPIISNPTNGVVARDAYLLFATKDDTELPAESIFSSQFGCLQETGQWCEK